LKNRIRIIALVCAAAMLLSGCRAAFDKEYRSEEVYVDEYFEIKDDTSVQEVKNYRGMKNALMNLINSAADYGKIRTEKYNGNPEDDISRVCFEVTREEPMGIYAVDYITHSINLIVSYYEIEVYITYRRTPEEIAGVVTVHSGREMQELLKKKIENFEESMAVMQVSTEIEQEQIENYINDFYRSDPLRVIVRPQVKVTSYTAPGNNIQEITEVELEYPYTKEHLEEMCAELRDYSNNGVTPSSYGDIDHVCSLVLSRCAPDTDIGESDAYTALVGDGIVDSEGFAMAAKLLCNAAGIEAYVVEGMRDGAPHCWNIVNVGGDLYHIDLFTAADEGGAAVFLSDADAEKRYLWDREFYPACGDDAAENKDTNQ